MRYVGFAISQPPHIVPPGKQSRPVHCRVKMCVFASLSIAFAVPPLSLALSSAESGSAGWWLLVCLGLSVFSAFAALAFRLTEKPREVKIPEDYWFGTVIHLRK